MPRSDPAPAWADFEPDLDGPPTFGGLTHAEVLGMTLRDDERYLIEDLVPAGAVGTIAGVPETSKSWLAQAIATRVAAGAGTVLERQVARQTRVGYFWQDDSTREEVARVQLFARVHEAARDLWLRWFLNEQLRLPADMAKLRATIETFELGLVILDSFYTVAPAGHLKDEEAEEIVADLKREIADTTGCTILIVDHMPWATETNRGRLRAYGGVHKAAATRFGIYIDAQGSKLWIESRGNNIRGFRKTPAYWDADALELRLVDVEGTHDWLRRGTDRGAAARAWAGLLALLQQTRVGARAPLARIQTLARAEGNLLLSSPEAGIHPRGPAPCAIRSLAWRVSLADNPPSI